MGGGYGLGLGRTDLYLAYPHAGGVQRIVLELKLRKGTRKTTIHNGLPQIAGYMDRCDAHEGHLIIFDQSDDSWDQKIFHHQETYKNRTIQVWGM